MAGWSRVCVEREMGKQGESSTALPEGLARLVLLGQKLEEKGARLPLCRACWGKLSGSPATIAERCAFKPSSTPLGAAGCNHSRLGISL